MADINQQQVFLYMPDISGFTKFISSTEIEHSTHIIQELLELIINANELKLELLEIEGDAVFFYRLGSIPTTNEIIQQSKKIFDKFHQHLLHFESRRICHCGACKSAVELTLKFVIHTGVSSSYRVNKQFKLIGKDVILLHRLLKNNIPVHEYLLFTEPFFEDLVNVNFHQPKLSAVLQTEEYDDSAVNFKYVPIIHWLDDIELKKEEHPFDKSKYVTVISDSIEINAAADIVFSYIADLSKRTEWIEDIKSIEIVGDEKLNLSGTVHFCILKDKSSVRLKTDFVSQDEMNFSFMELDEKKENFGKEYLVKGISPNSCLVQTRFFVKNNLILKTFFRLFMKNKMQKNERLALSNLKGRLEN